MSKKRSYGDEFERACCQNCKWHQYDELEDVSLCANKDSSCYRLCTEGWEWCSLFEKREER